MCRKPRLNMQKRSRKNRCFEAANGGRRIGGSPAALAWAKPGSDDASETPWILSAGRCRQCATTLGITAASTGFRTHAPTSSQTPNYTTWIVPTVWARPCCTLGCTPSCLHRATLILFLETTLDVSLTASVFRLTAPLAGLIMARTAIRTG
jgi:hypothetical protein